MMRDDAPASADDISSTAQRNRPPTVAYNRAGHRQIAARIEMERASKLKDDFLAMVSHDLRTPLNAVVGYAHMLRIGKVAPQGHRR